jgi:SAM-dependent methyltransferase
MNKKTTHTEVQDAMGVSELERLPSLLAHELSLGWSDFPQKMRAAVTQSRGSILEIGCGKGPSIELLARNAAFNTLITITLLALKQEGVGIGEAEGVIQSMREQNLFEWDTVGLDTPQILQCELLTERERIKQCVQCIGVDINPLPSEMPEVVYAYDPLLAMVALLKQAKQQQSSINIQQLIDSITQISAEVTQSHISQYVAEVLSALEVELNTDGGESKTTFGLMLEMDELKLMRYAQFKEADAQNLSAVIQPGSVGFGFANQVWQYLPDPLKAFLELYKVLMPGGDALAYVSHYFAPVTPSDPNVDKLFRKFPSGAFKLKKYNLQTNFGSGTRGVTKVAKPKGGSESLRSPWKLLVTMAANDKMRFDEFRLNGYMVGAMATVNEYTYHAMYAHTASPRFKKLETYFSQLTEWIRVTNGQGRVQFPVQEEFERFLKDKKKERSKKEADLKTKKKRAKKAKRKRR